MLHHCVFCQFNDTVSPARRLEAVRAFSVLEDRIDGVMGFSAGPNRDFEDKSGAYSHGFAIIFQDAQALQAYAEHPLHQQLGAELVALCKGGADGIIVFDIDA